MGTSDLNFYINKHRKAYEERLKKEQQNHQGKTSKGEAEGGAQKVAPSEVTKGGANEQSNEADNGIKNLNEGYNQHANQNDDTTRNSTRDENMNQVDADYLLALKLNEALNGSIESPSLGNENHFSSGSHARSAERDEDAERSADAEMNEVQEDDVRKPDNSYVECLLGDNSYVPFCLNYNVGNGNMIQNPLPPSGRNRISGYYVDHDDGGIMYGPYNLRSRNNRVNEFQNGFQNRNQRSGNSDGFYSSHFNSANEPINISLSSDDEEGEVQIENAAAKSSLSQDDGIGSSSDVFYLPDENLSLTPRQNKPNGQSTLGLPFSTRGEDSKEEVTIVEGLREGRFSDKGRGAYHHEEGNPDLSIQAHKGEEIPRMMRSAEGVEPPNSFSFQSVEGPGGGSPRTGHYNMGEADLASPKCTVEKSVLGLCDVYNDHFGLSSIETFQPVRSAATEMGDPLRDGHNPSGNNPVRRNYVHASPWDDYSQEGRYYVHYEPLNLNGKEKKKNKATYEGLHNVDAYGERVGNGLVVPSRGRKPNGEGAAEKEVGEAEPGDAGRAENAKGEYYKQLAHYGNDVIPLEGEYPIGGAPSSYKARAKKSRRDVKDITHVESIHSDEGLSPRIAQQDDASKMAHTLKSSRKHPPKEKIEDPHFSKGESYKAQNGGGVEGVPEDGLVLFKTGLGTRFEPYERNDPTMGVCKSGGYPKNDMSYADMGRDITQGEPSPFNMLHLGKENPMERNINDYVANNPLMDMDDSEQVFAEMARRCASAEKSNRLPFESLHNGVGVPTVGAIGTEGGLHSRTNGQAKLFSGGDFKPNGRAFTVSHVGDHINADMLHCSDVEFTEGATHRLPNYVDEGKNWSDGTPLEPSSVLRGVHFAGEVSSSSRMVEEQPLCGENNQHDEVLLWSRHGAGSYKMFAINRGANYQGRPEEKSKNEGHHTDVKKDSTLNRFNGTSDNKFFTSRRSPFFCTLGEAQGGATPDVYVIEEGTGAGEPHSTHEQNVQPHPLEVYHQGGILNGKVKHIGDMRGESAGSVNAEETQMEQVQEGRAVNSRGDDAHPNRDISDQTYRRGMGYDHTISAIDQFDEQSANDEDLSVQQAIINSLIDL
ncbi:hypothetical protein C922_01679 [Plasmodium inui San Antonio 1]|uniref:Uncharacterized protein n=1 Tax=Plasmodium inui San Antonio 1 TaxID=1237626 RepID=W7A4R9_9APIC|nr:hypothetical protein C922_01679 [Plasmodium inui San Antonio 1]EUD68067.1 hypothetical protein C922_01679 [Plasmodium inui San Antonio 1]